MHVDVNALIDQIGLWWGGVAILAFYVCVAALGVFISSRPSVQRWCEKPVADARMLDAMKLIFIAWVLF